MKTKEISIYISTALICIILLTLNLQGVDLTIPLAYASDSILNLVWIKGIVDHGWYLHNPSIGSPFGSDMNDFPMADNVSFFIMKVISWFTSNAGLVMNLFYLLTYPLTALTSFYVMRHLRVSSTVAMLGSILYAFLPYHLLRGEYHLFLGAYYMIPLITMVILWVWEQKWCKSRYIASTIIMAVVASSGIYYAFFTCVLIALVALINLYNQKKLKSLIQPVALVIVILVVGLINVSPSIIYSAEQGKNPIVAKRSYVESEIYGLKLTNLLLPANDHRIPKLAKKKNEYNTTTPLTNENNAATLGIIGSIGFLILVASLFLKHHEDTIRKLSILNISSFLLASIGGLGTIFAMLISPEIRGYNRISVFIAFFSLLAFCIILDKWKSKYKYAAVVVLMFIGIYDQTGTNFKIQSDYYKNQYAIDERFTQAVEKSVPPSSKIFELPYMPFPENGPINKMADYDPAKPYIHSKTLQWSYGAMKGREGDGMIKAIAAKPMDEMISEIKKNGYAGIYLDRNGFADDQVEKQLTSRIGEPIVSENKTSIFYKLP
jgi:phosphoglycerol transferase